MQQLGMPGRLSSKGFKPVSSCLFQVKLFLISAWGKQRFVHSLL